MSQRHLGLLLRLVLLATVSVAVLALAGGCGGGGEHAKVEDAAEAQLSQATDLHAGLNTNGIIVGVRADVSSSFSHLADIKVSDTKIKGDQARASVSFRDPEAAANCRGGVGLSKRDGDWKVRILTVSACD